MYEGDDIVTQVLNGDILLLPNNLYVWATMNTSDQSLFPIDSAFKRRWDWTYMPISNAEKNWVIEVGNNNYDWWQFLEKINEKIGSTTNSEDKKLGYFFCKAKDGVISAKHLSVRLSFTCGMMCSRTMNLGMQSSMMRMEASCHLISSILQ